MSDIRDNDFGPDYFDTFEDWFEALMRHIERLYDARWCHDLEHSEPFMREARTSFNAGSDPWTFFAEYRASRAEWMSGR